MLTWQFYRVIINIFTTKTAKLTTLFFFITRAVKVSSEKAFLASTLYKDSGHRLTHECPMDSYTLHFEKR